ncbi:MAG: hypothetical protein QNK23_05980 [Crocinitomicaceae bacterium]|nr:hypothetical protein [Crocinitomicaceae bacterium]
MKIYYFILTGLLISVIALIFSPIVWMEIGPGGYAYYGPTVPDVYIYGGFIFGKDLAFGPIDFAWKFQLTCILLYLFLVILSMIRLKKGKRIGVFAWIKVGLLFLFLPWISLYIGGVECNSDCAELTTRWAYGIVIYGILCGLNVLLIGLILLRPKY